jgi:hypothetical protein
MGMYLPQRQLAWTGLAILTACQIAAVEYLPVLKRGDGLDPTRNRSGKRDLIASMQSV